MTPDGPWSPHSPRLPIFQLVDVTVHPSLVCYQGCRLEQGRTPGLKRQGGQAEGLQPRLTSLPAAFTSRVPPPCSSSATLEGPSTRAPRKARRPLRTFYCHLLNPQSSSMCGEHGLPAARYRQAPEPLQGKHISWGHLQHAQPDGGCHTSSHLRIHSKRRHRRYTLQVHSLTEPQLHPGQRGTCEKPVLAPIHLPHRPIFPRGPPGTKEPSSQLALAVPRIQMYPGLRDRAELVANQTAWPQGSC